MKLNPETSSLIEEYMNNPSSYEDADDLITKCVSLERDDYINGVMLLKKYNRIEESVYLKMKGKELIEFEKNSNPVGFTEQIQHTCEYHKRGETKNQIKVDIRTYLETDNNVIRTIDLIRNISWYNETKIRLEQKENKMSSFQKKLAEGTEFPELLCWWNKEENS